MDSYALCPCGSGKKVKFCCQAILPEMARIEKLQENNQPRMALQVIDKLLKEHPQNAWLNNQRAIALIADHRHEEARDGLVAFLRKNPEHPLSNALLAVSMLEIEPIESCKKVIHRAFLKSMAAEPRIVSILTSRLVDHFLATGHSMAARQHMAVVLRLENENERQQTLMAMLEFDSSTWVPYPIRGAHPLPAYVPGEAVAAQFKKAQRLFVHACFSEAADLLEQVADQEPNSAELFHTIGLMRAWDGDELRAAAAMHRAAQLYPDRDRAIDVEAIAQLLQRGRGDDRVVTRVRTYETESLSKLLTRLDNEDRLSRAELSEAAADEGMVAAYDILDRALPGLSELEKATLDTLPRSIGQLHLYDAIEAEEVPAVAEVIAVEGDRLEQASKIIESAAGELIARAKLPSGEVDEDGELNEFSAEDLKLTENAYFPPQTPPRLRNTLRKQFVETRIQQTWLESPLAALGGRSPLQASGDPSSQVALEASLRVFDAILDRQGVILDQAPLRERLQLPAEAAVVLQSADADLNAYSVSQLLRVDSAPLSDELFEKVLQRAMVVKHSRFGHRVLSEFLTRRPELVAKRPQEAEQAHVTLSDLCSRSLRDQEALDWLEKGFQFTKSHSNAFETLLMWKLREISLRARDPETPEFRALLLEIWNYYGAKLPAVRARLDEFVRALKIDPPWQSTILTPQTVGVGEKAVWGAETEETSSAEKKLWLPD